MTMGKFITLEGGEGVGKSTNLLFVKKLLEQQGKEVITTREPGGTIFAEKIRQLLLAENEEKISDNTELLLMFAARSQHIAQIIRPALSKGVWVLCDRFTDATYAYQGGARGMDVSLIEWLEKSMQDEINPDLTLLLDAPVNVGMKRVSERGALDRFEREQMQFFEDVRKCYLQRAIQYPDRIKKIDADKSLEIVQADVSIIIKQFMTT